MGFWSGGLGDCSGTVRRIRKHFSGADTTCWGEKIVDPLVSGADGPSEPIEVNGDGWVERLRAFEEVPYLTSMEGRILASLMRGEASDLDIARAIGCSERAERSHVQALRAKFGVRSRTELVSRAFCILMRSRI
jgi:DNA-binding CsgD family transcriptional regulator